MSKSNLFILFIIILVFSVFITKNKVATHARADFNKQLLKYEDSIAYKDSLIENYSVQRQALQKELVFLSNVNDSLLKLKQKVKIKYEKIYININNASNTKLDSIIRANWW